MMADPTRAAGFCFAKTWSRHDRLERKTEHGSRPALFLFQANASIFHLASVAFETDTAGGGKFQSCLEHLTVANTVRDTVLYGDFNFIPILWSVLFKLFVGTGYEVITNLKLGLAEE